MVLPLHKRALNATCDNVGQSPAGTRRKRSGQFPQCELGANVRNALEESMIRILGEQQQWSDAILFLTFPEGSGSMAQLGN